jgi:DNA primase
VIPKQTIDEIFEAAIVEDVVGEFVPLKKRGANFLGNCPFHNEKTPSFTVSPAKGIYKCFGCGKAGNSVNFIMEHEHYSYPEALRFLANKYNIEIEEEEQTDEQKAAANERESLYIVSNYAANYFKKQLLETDTGKAIALSYFIERGFREDIIEKFQLGYSPDEWTAFTGAAEKEGHNLSYLDKTGLTIVKGDKKFDRFKGRVMFPIHSLSGRVLGFGGRILKSDDKAAKYLNSPESEIYSKSKVLYGIYTAKKAITQEDKCYLVEGYTDVISLYQSGVENVVSSSGTSLTEGQIRLIKRFTPNITILYDGDAAGLKASFRGIDMVLKGGMIVKVVLFPDGEDPDSYAKNHTTEELKEFISEQEQDFIHFKSSVLLSEKGADLSKVVDEIAESISCIIGEMGGIRRSSYIKSCAEILKIPEDTLLDLVNKRSRKRTEKDRIDNIKTAEREENLYQKELEAGGVEGRFIDDRIDGAKDDLNVERKAIIYNDVAHYESEIIRLLITYGNQSIKVEVTNEADEKIMTNTLIAHYILSGVGSDGLQFDNQDYQLICDYYLERLNEESLPTHQDFTNHPNPVIGKIAIDIFSTQHEISPNWVKHKIYITTEDQQLKKAIINTVYGFKLSKVNLLILENQEQLKTESEESKSLELIKNQLHLQGVKKEIAAKLGRIIIK